MQPIKTYKVFLACLLLASSFLAISSAQAQLVGRDGLPILDNPNATVGSSNCYFAHGGLGCDDAVCEATICAIDSFCCDTGWDGICAAEAIELCPAEDQDFATFTVYKNYSDGNPDTATVTLSCFTGLPLIQSQNISNDQSVKFIVQAYNDGELDCNVFEEPVPVGYTVGYESGGLGTADADGCHWEDLPLGANPSCFVTNDPTPVEVSVNKDWIIEGEGGDAIDPFYRLVLACHGEIIDGNTHGPSGIWRYELYDGSYLGTADATFTADVVPDWDGGTECWVLETVYDSGVEVNNGCGYNGNEGLLVELDGGDSCTVTNTVFFEGIPSLSQYGMAILAMLMLGLGFVGFRRFL